jgi:hypothetical protein
MPTWGDIAGVGGLTGIIAFFFALWDRYTRHVPIAEIAAVNVGAAIQPVLRITNTGPVDVLVMAVEISPPAYVVADHDSLRAALRAVLTEPIRAVISPRQPHDFLLYSDKYEKIADDKPIKIKIRWRPTSSSRPRRLPVVCTTSMIGIKQVMDAASRRGEAEEEANLLTHRGR